MEGGEGEGVLHRWVGVGGIRKTTKRGEGGQDIVERSILIVKLYVHIGLR